MDLFPRPQIKKPTHYSELNIHQKINVRANSCGFELNWYLASRKGFKKHTGFMDFQSRPNELTKRYFIHYKLNKGRRRTVLKTTLFN